MPRFFVDSVEGEIVEITGEDARHIALSLRMKNGEQLVLCDGKGREAEAVIREAFPESVVLDILSRQDSAAEPKTEVILYQALPKFDKLEKVYKNDGLKIYVTKEKLEAAEYKNVTDEMVKSLNIALNKYNITSQNEINHFLAQCRVESWYGKALTERNWPNEIDDVTYFNQKYSGRTNLGNNGGNDGYTYRGAGYIQLTGKGNYELFAASVCDNKILELGADYVAENYAWEAAAWFWTENVHSLFEGGNEPSVSDVTKIINKRQNHLAEREAAYKQLIENDC